MRVRTVGLILLAVLPFTTAAAVDVYHIQVRAILREPGCQLAEAQLEVMNWSGDYWYRVKLHGTYTNAQNGPDTCEDGLTHTACEKIFEGANAIIVTVPPCSNQLAGCVNAVPQGGWYLPTGSECPAGCNPQGPRSCDNITTSTSSSTGCEVTCGVQETNWCVTFNPLEVEVTQFSTDGSTWYDWPDEYNYVCGLGDVSLPYCEANSVCTSDNQPIDPFPNPPAACSNRSTYCQYESP